MTIVGQTARTPAATMARGDERRSEGLRAAPRGPLIARRGADLLKAANGLDLQRARRNGLGPAHGRPADAGRARDRRRWSTG